MTIALFASGFDHPEGIAWSPKGWIACGGEAGQIYRVDPESRQSQVIAETGGFILGIAFDFEDNLYACDIGRKAVLHINTSTGEVANLTSGADGEVDALQSPNFPVFHSDGRLFFSDSGTWGKRDGRILCLWPDGRIQVVSTQAPSFTNGLAIDPTQEFLYVVESEVPQVSRFELTTTGLGRFDVVVSLPRKVPDGLAFTSDGHLLIGCWRPDAVYLLAGSELVEVASDWTGEDLAGPTNLAFIGPHLDRLVTSNLAGRHLAEIETTFVGAPLSYPRR